MRIPFVEMFLKNSWILSIPAMLLILIAQYVTVLSSNELEQTSLSNTTIGHQNIATFQSITKNASVEFKEEGTISTNSTVFKDNMSESLMEISNNVSPSMVENIISSKYKNITMLNMEYTSEPKHVTDIENENDKNATIINDINKEAIQNSLDDIKVFDNDIPNDISTHDSESITKENTVSLDTRNNTFDNADNGSYEAVKTILDIYETNFKDAERTAAEIHNNINEIRHREWLKKWKQMTLKPMYQVKSDNSHAPLTDHGKNLEVAMKYHLHFVPMQTESIDDIMMRNQRYVFVLPIAVAFVGATLIFTSIYVLRKIIQKQRRELTGLSEHFIVQRIAGTSSVRPDHVYLQQVDLDV